MISIDGLTVEFGGTTLFSDLNFQINEKDRIALMGKNGAGKSTLLKILAGVRQPTRGKVTAPKDCVIAYLPQHLMTEDGRTVFEEASQAFAHLKEMEEEIERMNNELATRTDYESDSYMALIEKVAAMSEKFYAIDMTHFEEDVEKALLGLGFLREDFNRPTSDFSGGWRMRIELAKLLLQNPDVLLLDEPTNHLDLNSVEWLEGYIRTFKGTVLAISHDRYFIDQIAQRVIEITEGHAEFYSGNYSFYMDEKQARFDLQLKQYEQEQAKLKQLGYTLERMKGWGINNRTLYRRAMSIQHRMERIQKTEKPKKERTMKASFGERDFSGDVVFKMKNVAKSFGLRQLFSDINLNVEAGERIALLGDNGTGKSTFIKCLLGQEDFQGKIQFGPTVKWGYLPQIIHFDHPERTLYDTMLYEKNCSPQVARDRLGAFMFQGEDVFKTVGNLSGGEQSRLRLCMLMDEKINLLILDEPTNHLDIASREWVEAAIEEFEGVLLFVSHDRYFIEKFAERIWLLEDGTIRDFPCGYQKYRSILEHEAAAKPVVQAQPKPKKEKPKGGTKDQEKLVRRLEREIEKQEAVLAEFDTKIEAAGADYQELTRLLEEKEQQEQILLELMEQWEQAQQ